MSKTHVFALTLTDPNIYMSLATPAKTSIFILEPHSKEDIIPALKTLKDRQTVILNLAGLQPNQARQAADMLSGCSCATDGKSTWIDEQTYLFTPHNIRVTRNLN